MKKFIYVALLCFLMSAIDGFSQQVKGLYVNNFNQILGNTAQEDSLLKYAKGNAYNYLAFYSLASVDLTNAVKGTEMANFIRKAKTSYGIQQFGATGETATFFESYILPYNNSHPAEKFNVFNLEFEFWIPSSVQPGGVYAASYLTPNGFSLDTAGGFKYYKMVYDKIKSYASQQGALTETYVGWLNQGQAKYIATKSDRILVHLYRTEPNSTFNYSKTRLEYFASANKVVNIVPIFSSEPEFMGPWLASNTERTAYDVFMQNYNADNSAWKQNINISGYQWFKYSLMPRVYANSGAPTNNNVATGIEEEAIKEAEAKEAAVSIKKTLAIYPVPTVDYLNVELDPKRAKSLQVDLINVAGQLVYSKAHDRTNSDGGLFVQKLDLSTMAKGIYFLQIQSDEKVIVNKKIMLN